MFIKRDHRKISEILQSGKNEVLYLSKRSAEFNGSFSNSALYWNKNIKINKGDDDNGMPELNDDNFDSNNNDDNNNPLINLNRLNLYDNRLQDLNGFHALSNSPLIELNIGNNCLKELPQDFTILKNLKTLYMEDNYFEEFPNVLCEIITLTELRISQNHIKVIPYEISQLVNLITLAIDNNDLDDFPDGICDLPNLKHIWLRQNNIMFIPDTIDHLISLETLSLSSNKIGSLPSQLTNLTQLKQIYVNSNIIDTVPSDLPVLSNLITLNIANNELSYLPYEWENAWGTYDEKLGVLSHKDNADKSNKCTITVSGNPFNGVKSSKGKNMDIENSDSNKAIDGTIFNLLDADV